MNCLGALSHEKQVKFELETRSSVTPGFGELLRSTGELWLARVRDGFGIYWLVVDFNLLSALIWDLN